MRNFTLISFCLLGTMLIIIGNKKQKTVLKNCGIVILTIFSLPYILTILQMI
ncbi:hypothetical protein SAMN02745912_02478 [Paramaledivibacter caminithermalis DSM 15212]|jgi:hypothetical protein|uniref:Uncharacterized protein n=1 Tax=Paramaledivibacter caminithermalis (strain DSM 15212 / CIP 107654 / DViRD3) TaxID=1121301 RepID=A0A1M6Q952_PARC5|nr:hypothetical protein SAMN02745912_02478 [Paramaledivibacter caminithermalis DSM 15212]